MKPRCLSHGFTRAAAAATLAALLLAGCASSGTSVPVEHRKAEGSASATPALNSKDVYVVKKGDTLYAIALDQGLDYKDLVAWNNLENPNKILVGQQLKLNGRGKGAPAASVESNGVVVQAIGGGAVERRSLEGAPAPAASTAPATSPAASVSSPVAANAGGYKREPKAGKEVYSDAALARMTVPSAAAASAPTPSPAPAVVAAASTPKPEPKAEAKPEVKADSHETKAVGSDDIPWAWPAPGKVQAGFSASNKGLDIAGKQGDPVLAAADGKVAYIGSGIAALGKLVILRHNNNYLSAYAHNSNLLVKEGQNVSRGQKIAEFGSSGTDSVKLHFEIRRQGTPVDPAQYLPKR